MKRFSFILIAVIAIIASTAYSSEKEKTEFIYGAHFSSYSGVGSSNVYNYTQKILKQVSEIYPLTFKVKKMTSENDITQAFLSNTIDIGPLFPYQVAEIIKNGGDVYPLITYSIKKKRHMAYCFFSARNNSVKSVEDLQDKKLIRQMFNPFSYIQIRDFLYDNGIDKPLWEVFSTFTTVPNNNSAMMVLASGIGDVYWSSKEITIPTKYTEQAFILDKIEPGICTDEVYGHIQVAVNKGTVSESEYMTLRRYLKEILTNIDSYSDKDMTLKSGMSLMKLEQAEIVPADRTLFEKEVALRMKAEKNNWWTEAEFIVEKLQEAGMGKEVEIKPDFDFCKKTCPAGDTQCIFDCMPQ